MARSTAALSREVPAPALVSSSPSNIEEEKTRVAPTADLLPFAPARRLTNKRDRDDGPKGSLNILACSASLLVTSTGST